MIVKGCSVSVLTFLFRESQIFRSPIIFPISYVSNVYFLQCFTSSYELHHLPSSKVSSRSQLFLLFRQNHSKLPWVRSLHLLASVVILNFLKRLVINENIWNHHLLRPALLRAHDQRWCYLEIPSKEVEEVEDKTNDKYFFFSSAVLTLSFLLQAFNSAYRDVFIGLFSEVDGLRSSLSHGLSKFMDNFLGISFRFRESFYTILILFSLDLATIKRDLVWPLACLLCLTFLV